MFDERWPCACSPPVVPAAAIFCSGYIFSRKVWHCPSFYSRNLTCFLPLLEKLPCSSRFPMLSKIIPGNSSAGFKSRPIPFIVSSSQGLGQAGFVVCRSNRPKFLKRRLWYCGASSSETHSTALLPPRWHKREQMLLRSSSPFDLVPEVFQPVKLFNVCYWTDSGGPRNLLEIWCCMRT